MAWVSKKCVQVTIPDNATLSDESLRDHLELVAGPISSNGLKRMQRTCDGDPVNIIVRFDREQDVKKLPLDTTHQAGIDGVRQELYIKMCSLKQEKAHMMIALGVVCYAPGLQMTMLSLTMLSLTMVSLTMLSLTMVSLTMLSLTMVSLTMLSLTVVSLTNQSHLIYGMMPSFLMIPICPMVACLKMTVSMMTPNNLVS
ncbi:hypothetical protein LSAT2_007770 [Lamellibrachia satsuma]|nr:hypothetical protein LSAT2_007770 [Lamellibrachia satsuma]